MRLSGARPKRTWNSVVSSSTSVKRDEGDEQRAIEGARLVVDLGGVAGDRDEEAALRRRDRRCARPGAAAGPPGPPRSPCRDAAASSAATPWSSRCGSPRSHSERERASTSGLALVEPRRPASTSPTAAVRTAARRALASLVVGVFRRGDIGDQRAQIDTEPAVERRARPPADRARTARCR